MEIVEPTLNQTERLKSTGKSIMKKWQCQACNYTHTGDEPPESCPVCGVFRDLFTALSVDGQAAKAVEAGAATPKRNQCTVCGYVHQGEDLPENCPVCGVEHDSFSKITGSTDAPLVEETKEDAAKKRWRCEVCGYIHTGPSPPAKCPVCGADRSMFILLPEEKIETAQEAVFSAPETTKTKPQPVAETPQTKLAPEPSRFSHMYTTLTTMMSKLHAHPISVHIPNGVLPVAFLFLLLGITLESDGLLLASHYNLVFVLISMPVILFSGYNDWKIRLGGHMTQTIRIKIICGATVTGLSFVLVMWRFAQPHVLEPGSSGRFIYLSVFLVTLIAAAVAGFFGGKLIQFPGGDSLGDNSLKD